MSKNEKKIHLHEKAAKLSVFYSNRDLMKYISYIIISLMYKMHGFLFV